MLRKLYLVPAEVYRTSTTPKRGRKRTRPGRERYKKLHPMHLDD